MASEFEKVRTRILTGEGGNGNRKPQPQPAVVPLTPIDPSSAPCPSPPDTGSPVPNDRIVIPPTFISNLTTHVKGLSESRIAQGFIHLIPSPIHSAPYLSNPTYHYTYITDLFRRIDVNLFNISPYKLQAHLSSLLTRLIHQSTYLSHTGTDLATTSRICNAIFTNSGITELNLPHTNAYRSELATITVQGRRAEFSTVLKGREQVVHHTNAFVFFLTALISPGGELSQDLIKETHRILVRDNEPVDSKTWEQYGGWYRDYRLVSAAEAAASAISAESVQASMSPPGSTPSSRRSSSVYTMQPGFRRSSSIYTFQQVEHTRRSSSASTSSNNTSPTDPRRLSSIQFPITPITEDYEGEVEYPKEEEESPISNEGFSLAESRRESIDPRAVAIYMSKLISAYHAQLAMDRSPTREQAQQEEEATVSDPFALAAWLVTEFMHIHPFIVGNEEMCRIILSGVLMKELGIVAVMGEASEEKREYGREEYLGILNRCEERHREEGQQGHGESYAEFAALVTRKAVECVEELAGLVARS